jgi:NAD+ kinase
MTKIHLLSADSELARIYKNHIEKLFQTFALDDADVCVVLGGDGFMLQCLNHLHQESDKKKEIFNTPLYGINCGSIGFLMNAVPLENIDKLEMLLQNAVLTYIAPLVAEVKVQSSSSHLPTKRLRAINEMTLMRQTQQASHLTISVNSTKRLDCLIGDGVLVSTPAGSTAYNYSAGGPILPLGADVLALTPLNAYRPRWKGAILDHSAIIEIQVMDPIKRPVYLTGDCISIQNVRSVIIQEDQNYKYALLFDPLHNLESRILNRQFAV